MDSHPSLFTSTEKKDYPDSITTQINSAQDYLSQHNVIPIIHGLVELLVYHQPDNPRKYIIDQLRKLHAVRTNTTNTKNVHTDDDTYCLFTRNNLMDVFKIYDVAGNGTISLQQYTEAMTFLGIDNFEIPKLKSIPLDYFLQETEKYMNRKMT